MTHLNDYLIPCKNEELAKAWTDGDPLGGGLPEVTAADNGDVLTVLNGAWSKAQPSGGGIQVIDLNTLPVPTYNDVEIDSLFLSLNDDPTNLFGVNSYVCVGDAPESAVIIKRLFEEDEEVTIEYHLVSNKYNQSGVGLATSAGRQYCITNNVTIWVFEADIITIYFIPASAVIAPYNALG